METALDIFENNEKRISALEEECCERYAEAHLLNNILFYWMIWLEKKYQEKD